MIMGKSSKSPAIKPGPKAERVQSQKQSIQGLGSVGQRSSSHKQNRIQKNETEPDQPTDRLHE